MHIEPEVKSLKHVKPTFSETVASVHVNDVSAIGVQRSNGELIAQQVQNTCGKVKQRADAGIGLAVVVTQVTFEVSNQLGNTPVEKALPTIREPAIKFNLNRSVFSNWIREPVRHPVRTDKCIAGIRINSGLGKTDTRSASCPIQVVRLSDSAD